MRETYVEISEAKGAKVGYLSWNIQINDTISSHSYIRSAMSDFSNALRPKV